MCLRSFFFLVHIVTSFFICFFKLTMKCLLCETMLKADSRGDLIAEDWKNALTVVPTVWLLSSQMFAASHPFLSPFSPLISCLPAAPGQWRLHTLGLKDELIKSGWIHIFAHNSRIHIVITTSTIHIWYIYHEILSNHKDLMQHKAIPVPWFKFLRLHYTCRMCQDKLGEMQFHWLSTAYWWKVVILVVYVLLLPSQYKWGIKRAQIWFTLHTDLPVC